MRTPVSEQSPSYRDRSTHNEEHKDVSPKVQGIVSVTIPHAVVIYSAPRYALVKLGHDYTEPKDRSKEDGGKRKGRGGLERARNLRLWQKREVKVGGGSEC